MTKNYFKEFQLISDIVYSVEGDINPTIYKLRLELHQLKKDHYSSPEMVECAEYLHSLPLKASREQLDKVLNNITELQNIYYSKDFIKDFVEKANKILQI